MNTRSLTNAELAIMQLLWDEGPMTAREIQERRYSGAAKPQHGTVQRLLARLEEKELVNRDRSFPVHYFSAALGREAYAGGQLEAITRKLTNGAITPLITHLIEQNKLSRDDVLRLRKIVDQYPDTGESE